ncbi:hypothetical protein [Arthrobacter sp. A2-55]|uniref:hypothetical protein n=1 Tax=Arthrobacter sp. A2-55 TaxID=2897337 RepID=UPI0021CD6DA4|nr:hypothetical protein [Arthrobacter sp. A2-55]MCU6480521.1 hypothetical protein [Arthrobacter sp. A2-55]
MSVTFFTPAPVSAWAFSCGHENGVTAHRFATWQEASDFLNDQARDDLGTGALAVCGDDYCFAFGRMMTHAILENGGPSMQVSNHNAVRILAAIGLTAREPICGEREAENFMARVITSTPTDVHTADCLHKLREIAEFALETGRPVVWA